MSYNYNGVEIQECRTLQFEVVQERDPSNSDAIWNKYTIRVRGFVSNSPSQFRQDSAQALTDLKTALETPRRAFTYKIGNVVMCRTQSMDAHLGPDPMQCSVHEVTSGCFMVEAGVVVRVVECGDTCTPSNPIVSLRWSQTETFDQNWNSNLTTRGKLIVRSDLRQSADSFRVQCTPPILTDYQRVRSSYNLSLDGTELDFQFEDQEKDRLPPYPATEATGTFTMNLKSGARRFGQCDIRLRGPKSTSRQALLVRALQMAYSKFWPELGRLPNGQQRLPVWTIKVTEDLFEPIVTLSMGAEVSPLEKSSAVGALSGDNNRPCIYQNIGVPAAGTGPGGNGITPPDRKRLTALLAAAFNDPCACEAIDAEMRTTGRNATFNKQMRSIPLGENSFNLSQGATMMQADTSIRPDPTPFADYQIRTETMMDTSKRMTPPPGIGTGDAALTAGVVSVGASVVRTLSYWTATSPNPIANPNPNSGDPNVVTLKSCQTFSDVIASADGAVAIYRASGWFVQQWLNPNRTSPTPPIFGGYSTAMRSAAAAGAAYQTSLKSNQAPKPVAPQNPLFTAADAVINAAPPPAATNPNPVQPPPAADLAPFIPPPAPFAGLGGFTDTGGWTVDPFFGRIDPADIPENVPIGGGSNNQGGPNTGNP